jgi:hypothetical protein
MQKSSTYLGALALLATMSLGIAIDTIPLPAQAQTYGMQRRQERRNTRQESRQQKHECNANGGSSRSECRQQKREMKQTGRQNRW